LKKQKPKKTKEKGVNIMAEFPSNKPFFITQEQADKIFKNSRRSTDLTPEEREKIKKNAERWFIKPKKKD